MEIDRVRDVEHVFRADEIDDSAVYDSVEAAFVEKYGWAQSVLSAFRISRPTVLRMTPL